MEQKKQIHIFKNIFSINSTQIVIFGTPLTSTCLNVDANSEIISNKTVWSIYLILILKKGVTKLNLRNLVLALKKKKGKGIKMTLIGRIWMTINHADSEIFRCDFNH